MKGWLALGALAGVAAVAALAAALPAQAAGMHIDHHRGPGDHADPALASGLGESWSVFSFPVVTALRLPL